MTTDLLFVYGTLRRGEANHVLLGDSAFVGEATLAGNFRMVDLGAFPGVVFADTAARITGEVFEIDAETLKRADRLEGHPHMYRRLRLALVDQSIAWVYLYMRTLHMPARIIDGGDWVGRSGTPWIFR